MDRVYFGSSQAVTVSHPGNRQKLQEAVKIVKSGGVVAAQVYGVFGLFADGENRAAMAKILAIKGDPNSNKPFSSMIFSRNLLPYLNLDLIHPDLRSHFTKPGRLENLAGTTMHLRLPLRPDALGTIPAAVRSEHENHWIMHNLDPSHHPIGKFVKAANAAGVKHLAVTTLNRHGQPEITSLTQAIDFCSEHRTGEASVSLILADKSGYPDEVKGSFAIIDTLSCTVAREGFLPVPILESILGVTLNTAGMARVKFTQAQFFSQMAGYFAGRKLSRAEKLRHLRRHLSGRRKRSGHH